ncbi:MAG TPA: phosphomethylpyrimidine synthase ThiC [Candidatus Bathyarchaeota archaeon]|nr:phosphomethylpyrimidine synthase ThiC [Candidatus Bathyarchaeota archaeon]
MLEAQTGASPEELKVISKQEGVSVEKLRARLAEGRIIVIRNLCRAGRVRIFAIGEGLSTKVNVNIGTSATVCDLDMEREKARIAVRYGSDTIMDLSTGGDIDKVRSDLMKASEPLPYGTVPTYQTWIESIQKHKSLPSEDDFFSVIEKQLRDGVDFMTIHAGITFQLAKRVIKSSRIAPIVSRGGAMLAAWMLENEKENPYYEGWDYLLEMFAEHDATISLGDALRPGAIADAHDDLQISELMNSARLLKRARSVGVQVMVEGPGHMAMDKIPADIRIMKSLTGGAPYYVLGPLVTDLAVGYDHIAAAIGAAIAAAEGADLLCYLTPAEHLSLPNPEQVKEGLIASKIAAHAGDIIKLGEKAYRKDREMSIARADLNWEYMFKMSFDPDGVERTYRQFGAEIESCNMCGPYCVFLILNKYLKKRRRGII